MSKQSIFLSGWEYNRLLYDDPTQPRNSGIPAEVLWHGSAHFWLFDRVFVTRESFRGDVSAADALGWSSGKIFEELEKLGFIEQVDIKRLCDSDPILEDRLKRQHLRLKRQHGEKLSGHIAAGDWALLEELKTELLSPVFAKLDCANSISFNSIKTWTEKNRRSLAYENPIIASLAEKFQPSPINASLTRPPGAGVSDEARARQKKVQEEVEARMIFPLIESRMTHEEYENKLKPVADAYKPINDQLMFDFEAQLSDLQRLRDLASKHLWKDLHEDWIPQFRNKNLTHEKFLAILNRALNESRFDRFKRGGGSIAFDIADAVAIGVGAAFGPVGAVAGRVFSKVVIGKAQKYFEKKAESELRGFEGLITFAQQAKGFAVPRNPSSA